MMLRLLVFASVAIFASSFTAKPLSLLQSRSGTILRHRSGGALTKNSLGGGGLEQRKQIFSIPASSSSTEEQQTVIAPPSYILGLAFLVPSVLLSFLSIFFFPLLLFSVFLLIQTSRVRFVFDETTFSLQNTQPFSSELTNSGENFVVGGENRWKYTSFVNYDFFPSNSPVGPVLVYFKENQTPEDKWKEGPGSLDKVGGGQLHFFPAIVDADFLKREFERRGCAKL